MLSVIVLRNKAELKYAGQNFFLRKKERQKIAIGASILCTQLNEAIK